MDYAERTASPRDSAEDVVPTAFGDWLLIDDGMVDHEQFIDGGYCWMCLFCWV